MKFKLTVLSILTLLVMPLKHASAIVVEQDTLSTDDSTKVREFDFGVEYGNTRLYRGIKSSSNPYLEPSFAYFAKSGFFTGIDCYVPLDSGHIDETDLSVGYEFFRTKKTELSIELTHFFFRNNELANSMIKNEEALQQ